MENQKLYGDKETINRAEKAKLNPEDSAVYVNWEAINELPDEFEAQIVKVTFDIKKDFDPVGNGNYYPKPAFMNVIAEKRGIRGSDFSISEPIIQEVDINPLLMKPMEAPPTMQKKIVGKTMTKTGYVIESDGQERPCFPCTVDFNVWERCLKAWSDEEEKTNGYDSARRKKYQDGTVYYEYKYYDKQAKGQKTGKYYPKYDTKYKRQAHFNELMLFAQRNADTKSKNVVVRTITGMHTGYTEEELEEGFFIFHRICRSREILKLETVASLHSIEKGNQDYHDPVKALYGPDKSAQESIEEERDVSPESEDQPKDISHEEITPEKDPVKKMAEILTKYITDKEIKKNIQDIEQVQGLINWLNTKPDIEDEKGNGKRFWEKAIKKLKDIETGLVDLMRESHELY